jgi:hypothetical protein
VALPEAKRAKRTAAHAVPVPAAASLDTDIPVLGHEPFLQLALGGLPDIMSAFQGGLLGSAAAAPEALSSALLPATGQNSNTWHVGKDSLWYVPVKPMSDFLSTRHVFLCEGAWGGLQPGDSCGVTVVVLVPSGPQQQQQQQEEEEEEEGGMPVTNLDMPGDWQVHTQGDGVLSTSQNSPQTRLRGSDVAQRLGPLEDHFVLRAHFAQVSIAKLRLKKFVSTACRVKTSLVRAASPWSFGDSAHSCWMLATSKLACSPHAVACALLCNCCGLSARAIIRVKWYSPLQLMAACCCWCRARCGCTACRPASCGARRLLV